MPYSWRALSPTEQAQFDTGYAVFNTEFSPAGQPAGRVDGLGPIFNSQSCDSCHNSRRRGRGPRGDGEAPSDLVMQLGRLTSQGGVVRGNPDYGFVLNVTAVSGFRPEAHISIAYQPRPVRLADGTTVELREPRYRVDSVDGPKLAPDTVLMPRLPPLAQGDGMLERVPAEELERVSHAQATGPDGIHGLLAWVDTNTGNVPPAAVPDARTRSRLRDVTHPLSADAATTAAGSRGTGGGTPRVLGRFGWQASEPTVASQVAVAFAREMGLTNPLESLDDCAPSNAACEAAPSGGTPEVESELFDAVVNFERWQAVPVPKQPEMTASGGWLFESTGCAWCHQPTLTIDVAKTPPTIAADKPPSATAASKTALTAAADRTELATVPDTAALGDRTQLATAADTVIHPFTDLLLHDMGQGLADRTIADAIAPSRWRTAPLWGMHAAAIVTSQPQRYLHDGRARTIEEAILWHDGEGRAARDRFAKLTADQRHALTDWINIL